jgi:hypothetical protein
MSANSEQDRLDEALGVLRTAYNQEPSPRIESFLAARMRTNRRRKTTRLFGAIAFVCTALILLVWFGTHRIGRPSHPAPITAGYQIQVGSPPAESGTRPVGAEHVAVAQRADRVASQERRPPARPKGDDVPVSALFIAVPYAEPVAPFEQIDIYRVQLPRATLGIYGVPAAAGDLESRVTADVAVGSDGLVRAVRFVP